MPDAGRSLRIDAMPPARHESRGVYAWCNVVQNAPMTSPTTDTPIRLTITVDPHVHATFRRFADASGMSIGRAMGEWLGDTVEAAEFMASKMEQARAAPKLVLRELQAFTAGVAGELDEAMLRMRKPGAGTGAEASAPRVAARRVSPPSSNTGGKGRKTGGRGKS